MTTDTLTPQQAGKLAREVLAEIERAVVGKPQALELVMLGVLAGGHILIEDLPGLGKTLLARSFATTLGLDFRRIQFTPDLLPSDVSGAPFYDQRSGDMVFRPGPIFTNLLLADEINRTPPKTQAALLEAMAESQVSVDGTTHKLADPFVVIATANPIEYEGTYALPEAQLDRFLLRVRMGYLTTELEARMLRARVDRAAPEAVLTALTNPAQLLAMRASLEQVEVSDDLVEYVVALIDATRSHPQIQVGASPRGGLALVQLARARAALEGRDFLTPEDVKAVAVPALAHRVTLKPELWVRQVESDDVLAALVAQVPTPQTVPRASAPASAEGEAAAEAARS
ncbi:AAA family ATPase [Kitasatospora sp. NPDC008050]|uniref:AAA family ATPase n=1 Tax=Kitasatospora sp. NPDC008050 TaxID=3364021 RepID=UPI0036E4A114